MTYCSITQVECNEFTALPECGRVSLSYDTDNTVCVIIKDGDGKAVSIANDTVTITVKDYAGGSTIFTKSNGPGQHFAPENGTTLFDIAAADISGASPQSTTYWVFEVRRVDDTGDKYLHIAGDFIVGPTI